MLRLAGCACFFLLLIDQYKHSFSVSLRFCVFIGRPFTGCASLSFMKTVYFLWLCLHTSVECLHVIDCKWEALGLSAKCVLGSNYYPLSAQVLLKSEVRTLFWGMECTCVN